jgi:hypothetical protein
MSRRTVARRPDVLSFMLLTSSRTTWISLKVGRAVQMIGLDLALTVRWVCKGRMCHV